MGLRMRRRGRSKEGRSCDATRKFVDFHCIHPSVHPFLVLRRRGGDSKIFFADAPAAFMMGTDTDAKRRQETSIRFLGSLFVPISGVALMEAS